MEILNENEGQFWYDGIVIWKKVKLVGRKDLQQYDFQFHALTWKTKRLILKILFLWLLLLNLFTFGWRWSDANFPEANLKSFRRDSTSVGFTRWVNAHCTFANRRWKRSWFCFAIYLWFYFSPIYIKYYQKFDYLFIQFSAWCCWCGILKAGGLNAHLQIGEIQIPPKFRNIKFCAF